MNWLLGQLGEDSIQVDLSDWPLTLLLGSLELKIINKCHLICLRGAVESRSYAVLQQVFYNKCNRLK